MPDGWQGAVPDAVPDGGSAAEDAEVGAVKPVGDSEMGAADGGLQCGVYVVTAGTADCVVECETCELAPRSHLRCCQDYWHGYLSGYFGYRVAESSLCY